MNFKAKPFDNAKYRITDIISDLESQIKSINDNIDLQKSRINKVNNMESLLYNNFDILNKTLNKLHLELVDYKILTGSNKVYCDTTVELCLIVITLDGFEFIDYDWNNNKEYFDDDEYFNGPHKKLKQKAEYIETQLKDIFDLNVVFYTNYLKTFERNNVKLKISIYAE